jgi:hypothetical protein
MSLLEYIAAFANFGKIGPQESSQRGEARKEKGEDPETHQEKAC